jgi:hypothetical protein
MPVVDHMPPPAPSLLSRRSAPVKVQVPIKDMDNEDDDDQENYRGFNKERPLFCKTFFYKKKLSVSDVQWCSEKLTASAICVTFYILEKNQKSVFKLRLKKAVFY